MAHLFKVNIVTKLLLLKVFHNFSCRHKWSLTSNTVDWSFHHVTIVSQFGVLRLVTNLMLSNRKPIGNR